MDGSNWFDPSPPRILAHRGLAIEGDVIENVLSAFSAAWDAGARYLETDVRATKDGVAVLLHDPSLERVTGYPVKISDVTYSQLRRMPVHGNVIPTLEQVLRAFPAARWNIDVKDAAAIEPTAITIQRLGIEHRVLIASFSDRRGREMRRLLPGVVRSPSRMRLAAAVGLSYVRATGLVRWLLREFQAVQVPLKYHGIPVLTKTVIHTLQQVPIEIHVWTINDEAEMRRLMGLGVQGIFTDRVDVGLRVAREFAGPDAPSQA